MFTILKSMSTTRSLFLIAATALGLHSCAPQVDMPKGTSKGYTSARLVQRNPNQKLSSDTNENKINRMIQQSITSSFNSNGLTYGKSPAQLTVAYLVIYQEPGMTKRFDDYFGYGRSGSDIAEVAHSRGVIENKRADYFNRAGIVIDVLDSQSGKLVYRNFTAGDITKGASDSTRSSRIQAAVDSALAPFFGKK
jgi:hypothetical protein